MNNVSCFGVMFSILLLAFSPNLSAEWVQATGKASVKNGQYEFARKQARDDALVRS